MAEGKKLFHEHATEVMIRGLEDGTSFLLRPLEPGRPRSLPRNALTDTPFTGVNAVLLAERQRELDSDDPRWCTWSGAQRLGAQVEPGAIAVQALLWKDAERIALKGKKKEPLLDENGEQLYGQVKLERPEVFLVPLFHASQIQGLPPLPSHAEDRSARLERCEKLLQLSGATILHDQDKAAYQPATDEIFLPSREQFAAPEAYYVAAFRQLASWTGHEGRLNRDNKHPAGSEQEAKEQLRIAFATYKLGAELGLGYDPTPFQQYAARWAEILRHDPGEIARAGRDAEKICVYMLYLEPKREQEQQAEQTQSQSPEHMMEVE